MKKTKVFRMLTVISTVSIVVSMTSITAFAEEPTFPLDVDGDVTTNTVVIDHDVSVGSTSQNVPYAISASNDAIVEVKGDLEFNTSASDAYAIKSDISAVTVEGDLVSSSNGIYANHQGEALVCEDVKAKGIGVTSADNSAVGVKGTIEADKVGAQIMDSSNLCVEGDIKSGEVGILYNSVDTYANSLVVVEGTIKADDCAVVVTDTSSYYPGLQFLVVHKFDVAEDHIVGIGTPNTDTSVNKQYNIDYTNAIIPDIKNAIQYIMRIEDNDNALISDNAEKLTYTGSNPKVIKFMSKENTVNMTIDSNYYLTGNDAVTITQNSDGTYSITLNNYLGGIQLQILRKAIEEAVKEIQEESTQDNDNTPPAPTTPNIVVTNGTTIAPAAVEGAVTPARTVSFNISDVTPSEMKQAIVDNIVATPADGTLRIETDKVSCLDTAMLQSFEEKGNIDLELIFTYNGQRMRVFIPRGTKIRDLLDANGYCGYLRLAELLGYQII